MPVMLRDYASSIPEPAVSTLFTVLISTSTAIKYLIAEQVNVTFWKIPAEARFVGGSNDYFPGVKDVDGISVSFYETHDFQVSKWLYAWQKQVYKESSTGGGIFGSPNVYKQTIVVNMFSKYSTKPAYIAKYSGCWPTDKGAFDLNTSDETGRLLVQANFSVDDGDYL